MSSRFLNLSCAAAFAALAALSSPVLAQSDDNGDPEIRIQRLEDQLRQLTGQNEELQHRNQVLEQQLNQLRGGVPPAAGQPGVAAAPPSTQPARGYGQPQAQPGYSQSQPGYSQPQVQPGYAQSQLPAPAPIVQEPAGAGRRDVFDPTQHPNAPGVPRPLGGGARPIPADAPAGAPGAPLNLDAPGYQQGTVAPSPTMNPNGNGLATAPPSSSPRDEYDLGIGYMQRRDYALAEQTMRNFALKFPNDKLVGDSQYWLGESYYQRQQYRDAAEAFLAVTTKYEKSAKAPDALLRLGQSLAALKQKEAACASYGEVLRKYPRASTGVKAAVEREQKKEKC
jgi:tol-pal system protein YbgF